MASILKFLAFLGIVLSGLSLYEDFAIHAGLSAASFCQISETVKCEGVLKSAWSSLFGVPLAAWGVFFFLGYLWVLFLTGKEKPIDRQSGESVALVLSLFGSLFSIYLFLVSKFLIGFLCPLCLATYAVHFLMLICLLRTDAGLSIWSRLREGVLLLARFPAFIFGFRKPSSPVRPLLHVLMYALVCAAFFAGLKHYVVREAEKVSAARKTDVVTRWENAVKDGPGYSTAGPLEGDFSIGDESAPIQIVEFSDFECPICRIVYGELHPVLKKYEGKVFFVLRNFPLDRSCNPLIQREFHRNACYAAELTRCAGEQGKFWEAVDYLSDLDAFDKESDPRNVRRSIRQSAEILSMDGEALDSCIQSMRQRKRIAEDIREADSLKIAGTPAIWINGKRFEGRTQKDFEEVFIRILSR